jgi:predicted regulator of Ras-like GTPase activity (Roadblock/LC7/MglB family)
MKIPFLKQLQRLTGPTPNEVELTTASPEGVYTEQTIRHLLDELPDLLMAAVVDVATGKPLATYTTDRELRPAAVAGYNAEAVRQVQASLSAQQVGADQLEEMLFTLPSQLHLLHLAPSGQRFVYLAVDSRDTNLGIARAVMRGGIELLEPLVVK